MAAADSPLVDALLRVGDRWSFLVVDALLAGPQRFNELSRSIAGIAPNILTDRLRRLESAGVVASEPYSERPLRHVYRLTDEGRELAGRAAAAHHVGWSARPEGRGPPPFGVRHASRGPLVLPDLRARARGGRGLGPATRVGRRVERAGAVAARPVGRLRAALRRARRRRPWPGRRWTRRAPGCRRGRRRPRGGRAPDRRCGRRHRRRRRHR